MGLLDSVIGAMGSSQGGGAGAAGGGHAALLNAVIGMLGQGGAGAGTSGAGGMGAAMSGLGGLGGLAGLVGMFAKSGLGDQVNSWVGTGQNLPVSGDQVTQALGSDTISQLARQLGLGQGDVAGQLSQMLPQMIDKLTPRGQLPAGNELSGLGDIGSLLGGFLKR